METFLIEPHLQNESKQKIPEKQYKHLLKKITKQNSPQKLWVDKGTKVPREFGIVRIAEGI